MPTSLTARERQIVQLISKGLRNGEIARELDVSEHAITVEVHHIFLKLVAENRLALAALAHGQ